VTDWRKSSHSGSQPETCVECAYFSVGQRRVVGFRDSTDPDGPCLLLEPEGWSALLTRLKHHAAERTA
jgi:hypothetical protein